MIIQLELSSFDPLLFSSIWSFPHIAVLYLEGLYLACQIAGSEESLKSPSYASAEKEWRNNWMPPTVSEFWGMLHQSIDKENLVLFSCCTQLYWWDYIFLSLFLFLRLQSQLILDMLKSSLQPCFGVVRCIVSLPFSSQPSPYIKLSTLTCFLVQY